MRLSTLGLGELFFLAFTKEAREKLAEHKRQYFTTTAVNGQKSEQRYLAGAPAGTQLIGFTLNGRDRYPTETAAFEAAWSANRKANPVPVFRAISA